jgi:predicted phosphohydrolase
MKNKYLWFTDTHLNRVNPLKKLLFIRHIIKEDPKAIFLTGDISTGMFLYYDLYLLATFIKCPIYFVLGNHDYWTSSIEKIHDQIRSLCKKFPQLIWLSESDVISLNDNVAVIGDEGWFDGWNGDSNYLKLTIDQYFIENFRKLPSIKERLDCWREMAQASNRRLEIKLRQAMEKG